MTSQIWVQRSLLAVLVGAALLANRGRASVLISEIMYNPAGVDRDSLADPPYDREWVELFNASDVAVDVSGWQFGDIQDGEWATPFPHNTFIYPQQTLIVTGDAASFDANWGGGIHRIQVGSFPTLANTIGTNEAAALRNSLGVLQNAVRFQDAGWPASNGSHGNSIFLLPEALSTSANKLGSNWKPSSQGVYGARWTNRGGQGENHGSPGFVATEPQAPFAPSPDAVWSMVVLPDTQNYVKNTRDLPFLHDQISWILDNRQQHNIQLVIQEGDIVNQNNQVEPTSGNQSSAQQWANAREAFSRLNGQLPYIMAVGNHDLGTTNAQSRETFFNDYFKAWENPLVNPAQGGILKGVFENGKLENAYFELKAPDGRQLLIFSLEYWPRQAVINWANSVAARPQFANHTAILLTHSYMNWDEDYWRTGATVGGLGTDGNDGEEMWHELVKLHGNFEMTLNGHIGGDGVGYKRSLGVNGNPVHQMLINTQFETNGGNGWLRLIEFLDDGKSARVRTYSPYLDLYRTGPAHEFVIDLSQLPMMPGDFNADGSVDNFDLAMWRQKTGMTVGARRIDGDADRDGDVDGADFLAWQRNLGAAPATAAANPTPEPASLIIAALALAAACGFAPRRRA
jgi:hypothetical protein